MTSPADRLAAFPIDASVTTEVTITAAMVDQFAALSGDDNSLHMNDAAARAAGFSRRVVHGALAVAFVSALIGKKIPGEGALWRSLDIQWSKPIFAGDTLTLTATVAKRSISAASLELEIVGRNQLGSEVLRARARVGLTEHAGEPNDLESVARARPRPSEVASQRVALVTGASRGIGRAVAIELARRGHAVAAAYHRNEAAARELLDEIRAFGGRAIMLAFDARAPGEVPRAIARITGELGAPCAFVHAASPPLVMQRFEETEDAAYDAYWNTYVRTAIAVAREMAPAINAAKWGRLVFVGTSALIGPPPAKMTAYVTAKSAVLGLMRSLAVELGPMGATVNVISPGLTQTDLTRDYSPRVLMAEAQRAPIRRLATAEDSAHVAAFLLSDQASAINGAHLPINGGAAMSG